VLSIPTEHLRWWGWKPWQVWSGVEWCGHQIEDRGGGGGDVKPVVAGLVAYKMLLYLSIS
jgi:hypothetical protein